MFVETYLYEKSDYRNLFGLDFAVVLSNVSNYQDPAISTNMTLQNDLLEQILIREDLKEKMAEKVKKYRNEMLRDLGIVKGKYPVQVGFAMKYK